MILDLFKINEQASRDCSWLHRAHRWGLRFYFCVTMVRVVVAVFALRVALFLLWLKHEGAPRSYNFNAGATMTVISLVSERDFSFYSSRNTALGFTAAAG